MFTASKLDKKLGDQLFEKEKPEEERDVDFFEASAKEAAAGADAAAAAPRLSASASLSKPAGELTASLSGAAGAGSKPAGKKIGGGLKKKAGGIGKKKVGGGLGAVKKTTTNFDEIEKKVTAEDAEREQHESANSPTDGDTERSASSRLKYQESSTKRDISKMNEQKREQAERLGMGMGRATTNKAVFSHSSSAAVQKIDTDYEEGETSRSGFLDREPRGYVTGPLISFCQCSLPLTLCTLGSKTASDLQESGVLHTTTTIIDGILIVSTLTQGNVYWGVRAVATYIKRTLILSRPVIRLSAENSAQTH